MLAGERCSGNIEHNREQGGMKAHFEHPSALIALITHFITTGSLSFYVKVRENNNILTIPKTGKV